MEKLLQVAANGLLDRRSFLRGAAAITGYVVVKPVGSETLAEEAWSRSPGETLPAYGVRSPFEKNVVRTLSNPNGEPRTSHARTPHHLLAGTITPNGLHFTIVHAGIPDIEPEQH